MRDRWLWGAFFVALLWALPLTVQAREGWYVDFAAGPNVHVLPDSFENNFPYGAQTESEIWFLQQANYGYSFRGPFSLGLGVELDNFIDVEFKANLKWSFLEEGNIEPYTFLALHGGITDTSIIAGSLGFGVDQFATDNLYVFAEARAGPAFVSDVPERDFTTGSRHFRWRIDGALCLGIGYSFGSAEAE